MLDSILEFPAELWRNVRIADLFDIAFISILLYSALIWFQETAYRSVVVGIALLAIVYFVARAFDMYLTSLVFQAGLGVLLIALVVVFQEDLRRAFERIAAWGTVPERRRATSATVTADTLVEVVSRMGETRVGALIVVKAREPLSRHYSGGIRLDGQVSRPLLYSIFDPHSPGHDGAVIIEGDRITKFGVHLPLSTNLKEVGGTGTRHSAALGLSERTDAFVIVVSEERGTVSVARHGKLNRVESATKLKSQLQRFLDPALRRPTQAAWKSALTSHGRLKAVSVFFAILMWFLYAYEPQALGTVQRTFVVPIEYRNLARDMYIEGPTPDEARLTLSGSDRAFNLFSPSALSVSLDMSLLQDGDNELTISQENIGLPSNLQLYRVEPRVIQLRAYRMIEVTLPVEVQTIGTLPNGLRVIRTVPVPDAVKALVPKAQRPRPSRILTEPIDLRSTAQSTTVTTRLFLEEYIRLPEGTSREVRVTIEVAGSPQAQPRPGR